MVDIRVRGEYSNLHTYLEYSLYMTLSHPPLELTPNRVKRISDQQHSSLKIGNTSGFTFVGSVTVEGPPLEIRGEGVGVGMYFDHRNLQDK